MTIFTHTTAYKKEVCSAVLCVFFSVFTFSASAADAPPQAITSDDFQIIHDAFTFGSVAGASATFQLTGAGVAIDAPPAHSDQFTLTPGAPGHLSAPLRPTLSNDGNYYDKLSITLEPASFAPDTRYAVAISDDGWVTERYISAGNVPVDGPLTREMFFDYDYWGGEDGTFILGLDPDTAYKARVAALHDGMTQGAFSPSSAPMTTSVPFVRLSIIKNVTDFSILNTNTIAHATSTDLRVSTNNDSGYRMYMRGTGDTLVGGLYNNRTQSLIVSDNMILAPGIPGYGAQATSPSALLDNRYTQGGNIVGQISTRNLLLARNTVDVDNELTQVQLKVSIDGTTSAGHYRDIIYYTVAANL